MTKLLPSLDKGRELANLTRDDAKKILEGQGLTPLPDEDIERYRRKRRLDLYGKKIWNFYSFDRVWRFFLVIFILLNLVVLYQVIMDTVVITDEIFRIATYTMLIFFALSLFVFPLGFIIVKHKYRISTKIIIFDYLKDLLITPAKRTCFISTLLWLAYANTVLSLRRLMSVIDLELMRLEEGGIYLLIGVMCVVVFLILMYLVSRYLKQMHNRWGVLEFKDFNIAFFIVIFFNVLTPVVLLFKFLESNVQKDQDSIWLQIYAISFSHAYIIMYFIFIMYDSKTIHAYQKKYRSLFKKIY